MGDYNHIFIEKDSGEIVWEGASRVEAYKFLRSDIEPGIYNILSRIEIGVLIEPPKTVKRNKLHTGQKFRQRRRKADETAVTETAVAAAVEEAIEATEETEEVA